MSIIRCNTLQSTATHCNTLQHTATRWLSRMSIIRCDTLQHTATHCNALQHTATHCNTLTFENVCHPLQDNPQGVVENAQLRQSLQILKTQLAATHSTQNYYRDDFYEFLQLGAARRPAGHSKRRHNCAILLEVFRVQFVTQHARQNQFVTQHTRKLTFEKFYY